MKNQYCVIMAGGVGSRFWPLSRANKPKQFVDAMGIGKTFIQMTYERFARFIPKENFIVVTGVAYKDLVLEQLPMLTDGQVLLEPCRRNTAPCIALATYAIKQKNPDAVVVVTPSDQLILDVPAFEKVVKQNIAYAANHDALLTIGITPSYPATGYGYIEVASGTEAIRKVTAFKEKPELAKAKDFLQAGNYVWNSGMFVWSVNAIDQAFQKHLSEIGTSFEKCMADGGTQELINDAFEQSQSISIDYGIMEKASNVFVSPADFGWSDVGTWGSLYEQLEKEEAGNAISGAEALLYETESCLVKQLNTGKLVVVDGLTDYMVVDTDDVLMICRKDSETRVKELIEDVVSKNKHLC